MTAQERIPVLTFLTNFLIGGTERQVINLVQNQDRARFDVHLGCFRAAGPLLQEIQGTDVTLSEYPITTLRSFRTLRQQIRLASYLRKRRIRVVHAFGFYANTFATPAARLARVEVVVASIRDTGDHLTPFQRRVQKWACHGADQILVNAQAISDVLVKQGYDRARIGLIPNGIDVSRFVRPRGALSRASQWGLGLQDGSPVVAAFARLNRLKGIEYFLEAASILSPRFPEVRFLVVGDSISQAYRDELESLAARLNLRDRVVFTGFRSDVPELLSGVSVSVLPSLSEGLSNVVLEAMAAGVPVVATAVGGTPEMVEHGVTGMLVPPHDAGAMAEAVAALLNDPERARAIGLSAQANVIARFSLEAAVRNTEHVYERLLSTAASRRRKTPKSSPRRELAVGLPSPPGLPEKEWP